MYIPKHFVMQDHEAIYDFIEKFSFGMLISNHSGSPVATHLPLLLDRNHGCLTGHFASPNNQWRDIANQEVLVVFQGPHTYISPSWYESDQSVPTWNYAAVHVYGEVELVEEEQEVIKTLNKMVEKYEGPDGSYRLDRLDTQLLAGLMRGIVCFKITITRMEAKAKLSQNHSQERRERVINQLESQPGDNARQIAAMMRSGLKN